MSTLEYGSERGVLLTNTDNSGSEPELPRRRIHELGGRSRALIRETRRVGPVQAIRSVVGAQPCTRCGARRDAYAMCPSCGYAAKLTAADWVGLLVDRGTFVQQSTPLDADPLIFELEQKYAEQLEDARARTHVGESVLTGRARLDGCDIVVVAFDFGFLGGSLGIAAGEYIVEALASAAETSTPVLMVVASSGARMQEGLAALFQMVRTSAAAVELRNARVPFVAILADPTTGAPYASVANLADVVLAESGALIGFAGPRVVEAVTGKPTEGLHAEELVERGIVDSALPRSELRAATAEVIDLLMNPALFPQQRTRGPLPLPKLPADRWALVESIREDAWPSGRAWLEALADRHFELRGDRTGEDDPALVAAIAAMGETHALVLAQDRTSGDGLIKPSGYRKAQRALKIAARLGLPVLTLLDGPGAAVGEEADGDGIAYWLAETFAALLEQPTPVVSLVVGQGSSGGAIALAAADRLYMLEQSIFTVISPEGAAAIISRDADAAPEWAEALRLTAADAAELGLVDGVIPEPRGPRRVARSLRVRRVKAVLDDAFSDLWQYEAATLPRRRRERFLSATRSLTSIHETDETRVQSVSPETVNDDLKDIA